MYLLISSPRSGRGGDWLVTRAGLRYARLGIGGDLQSWIVKCPTPGDNASVQIPYKSPHHKARGLVARGIDPESISSGFTEDS